LAQKHSNIYEKICVGVFNIFIAASSAYVYVLHNVTVILICGLFQPNWKSGRR